jgi:hypothetical protein
MSEDGLDRHATQPMAYRFNNGVPNQITLYATPYYHYLDLDSTTGIFGQGRMTLDRLSVSYGVRYDRYKTSFPEMQLGPGPLVPNRNVLLAAATGESWNDITPKMGASYDFFGNGKTALKVSLNKYLEGIGFQAPLILGEGMAPVNRLVTNTTRSWADANRNYIPECDLVNPAANGECGAMANQNFGTLVTGASYDPELLSGWGKRGFNWEFSAGVQQEVMPRVAVDVSYFRRWYGNFIVTDNRAVGPADYDVFSITAPVDPRLPGGGGYTVNGVYDLKPAKFGVPADNYITHASNYGKQTEHWNGVDVTLNARPREGALLQGGLSTGRASTNNCEVVDKLPEARFGQGAFGVSNANVWMPSGFCDVQEGFRTQVKFVGSYTVPRVDVQVAAVFRNQPGPQILANYIATNAVVAPSLGRSLSGGAANITVNVVEPGTLYGGRLNQLDLRFGKMLRVGRTRTLASIDLYNALNGNAVLTINNAFATWQRPQSILLARFVKLGVQFDF